MQDNKCYESLIKDNKTQPIFDCKEAVWERVYVETPVDTDGDGKLDLVAVYIRCPKETLDGLKVPAIYIANPYMMHCNENWYVPHDVDRELKAFPEQNIVMEDVVFDEFRRHSTYSYNLRETKDYTDFVEVESEDFEGIGDFYDYFLSRGYAIVLCGGLGTKGSQGFTITGSQEEILAFKSVIDWMCGRVRAFTNLTDNIERKATWCTGKVAMSGKSYLGTLAVGVAMTGVEGLETIIPEAAISNWYEYYRSNGLVVPALDWQGDDLDILAKYCFSRALEKEDYLNVREQYNKVLEKLLEEEDRDSGNYNRFWDERNYLKSIKNMKASALIIHGINDWNVKLNHCINLWKAMYENNLKAKILLHQGDHIYIYDMADSVSLSMVHKWLDYYLYGIENGMDNEDENVWVQSNQEQSQWFVSQKFPPKETEFVKYPIGESARIYESDNQDGVFVDDLAEAGFLKKGDEGTWLENLISVEKKNGKNYPCALKYLWNPFAPNEIGEFSDYLRITGRVEVEFECSLDRPTGILSTMLVEYGENKRLTVKKTPLDKQQRTWGKGGLNYEEQCFEYEEEPSFYKVISRGHINAQNLECNWKKSKIISGEKYKYSFDLIDTDYVLRKGMKLGLIIYGSDPTQTIRSKVITKIKVEENTINVKIPILVLK